MYLKIPVVRDFAKIERLFKIVSENNLGYIAGGFVRFAASPKKEPSPYRDVDIFTRGLDQYKQLVRILKYEEHLNVKIETEMSITFKTDNNEVFKDCPMINLVKPINKNKLLTYGDTLETVLDNFDFSICRIGLISSTECLAWDSFLFDEKNKNITILKMESPIAIIARLCKYAEKGYKVNIPSIVTIFQEWEKRGPEYKDKIFKALERLNKGEMSLSRHSSFNSGGYVRGDIIYDNISPNHSSSTTQEKTIKPEFKGEDFKLEEVVEVDKTLDTVFSSNFNDENLYDLIRIG